MKIRLFAITALLSAFAIADTQPADKHFPDVEGYKTLVCDFHTHTVFSDGSVWPVVRVEEAYREGIDVLALTDHVGYHRFKDDFRTDSDRPHEIALPKAQELDVLLIKGCEISKDTPPGSETRHMHNHYNAIMVTDVNQIDQDSLLDAARIASKQGGFVTWNHHAWQGEEKGKWEDMQTRLYENKWLNGMEVANGGKYFPMAHQWCLDKNLTMLGNSDIHDVYIEYKYTPDEHRTLTLVFAKDKTLESVREALFAGRTAVWLRNSLIGRPEQLEAVFDAAVEVAPVHLVRGKTAFFEISNNSLMDMKLKRAGKSGPWYMNIRAKSSIIESFELSEDKSPVTMNYTVENMLIAPDKSLSVEFEITIPAN